MVVEVGLLEFVDHFGGDERAGGVIGFRLQVLIFGLVLLVSQFRSVTRRLRLGLVHSGLKVRDGYFGHLKWKFRGHLRPQMGK